jgi:hypothetical protein
MYYILCIMYYVLRITYYVFCIMYYVLCIMYIIHLTSTPSYFSPYTHTHNTHRQALHDSSADRHEPLPQRRQRPADGIPRRKPGVYVCVCVCLCVCVCVFVCVCVCVCFLLFPTLIQSSHTHHYPLLFPPLVLIHSSPTHPHPPIHSSSTRPYPLVPIHSSSTHPYPLFLIHSSSLTACASPCKSTSRGEAAQSTSTHQVGV